MIKRVVLATNLVVLAVGAGLVLGTHAATGQTTGYVNLEAPTFAGREYSTHNNGGSPACGAQVPLSNGGENRGDLDNSKGSYLAPVVLPQGATITSFRLFVNDGDADTDVFAYLLRRKLFDGQTPAVNGYVTIAATQSTGAVIATVREFKDDTIKKALVDNTSYFYYTEIVDCGIPEPYAVQVVYTLG